VDLTRQKAGKKRIRNRALVQQALNLRTAGASYDAIGKSLRLSKTRAYELVMDGLAELEEKVKDSAINVRTLEVQRLDAIILSHWPTRHLWKSAEILIRVMERRAKLLGLDAPIKTAQTTPDGEALPPALDLSKLTDEQLAALDAIYAAGAPQPSTTLEEV
jgi:hypothetical protein